MSQRAGFLALAAGIVVGLALGLLYSWRIAPVELYNTTPAYLRSDYRHDWIRMAALGYVADGDMERALARLEGLEQEDLQAALATPLIERYAAQGQPAETMRALSRLAQRLGVETPAMQIYLGASVPVPTVSPPSPSPPPPSPPPPMPSPTPFFSPLPISAPYRVLSQTLLCDGPTSQLQVLVRAAPQVEETDSDEQGIEKQKGPVFLSGVVLWLMWPGGADRAVTGLRPDISPGYADFTLQPDTPYTLGVGEPGITVLSGLVVQLCPAEPGAEPHPGSWRVVVEKKIE